MFRSKHVGGRLQKPVSKLKEIEVVVTPVIKREPIQPKLKTKRVKYPYISIR